MTGIYDSGEYLKSNPSWHEEDSEWKANKVSELIERNSLSLNSVCEVGCGAGEILHILAKRYESVKFFGYEISPQAYDICSKKKRENLDFSFEDFFESNTDHFDVVMAIDVFEHVEDHFRFLRSLEKRADYKVFHIPLDLSVQTVLRASPLLNARKFVGHLHYFTKETALATLEETGFEIVDYFYTGGSIELPNRGWKANLMNIPRKIFFRFSQDLTVRVFGGYSLMVLTK